MRDNAGQAPASISFFSSSYPPMPLSGAALPPRKLTGPGWEGRGYSLLLIFPQLPCTSLTGSSKQTLKRMLCATSFFAQSGKSDVIKRRSVISLQLSGKDNIALWKQSSLNTCMCTPHHTYSLTHAHTQRTLAKPPPFNSMNT